ncbi:uncharacterized protein LOC134262662 [Saccostrea cucullata]|uniref:uncharacterized protein LOC134262662 n=1 Tax=Saccostrea cuccullata TaxID=36930 RepID=UPI002ED3459D
MLPFRLCRQHVHPKHVSKVIYVRQIKTGYQAVDTLADKATFGKIDSVIQWYEDKFGLSEVRRAQEEAIKARQRCMDLQKKRIENVKEYLEIQKEMESVVKEIMQTERGTDRYVQLAIQENEIIKRKNEVKPLLEMMEEEEKLAFDYYNSKVSESHEKERLRTENFKLYYLCWSIAAVGLGLLANFIYNRHKNKEFRDIVLSATGSADDYKKMTNDLIKMVQDQQKEIRGFFNEVRGASNDSKSFKDLQATAHVQSSENISDVLKGIKSNHELLIKELGDLKKVTGINKAKTNADNVVYVGPEVKDLLSETESNIQWTVKIGSLASVTVLYGALALTIPLIMKLFKGE